MTIEERLARQSPEDIIHLGNVVEAHYAKSELFQVIRALVEGRKEEKLMQQGKESADYVLGMLKGFQRIRADLEQMIVDRDNLRREKPRKRKKKKATYIAEEPVGQEA